MRSATLVGRRQGNGNVAGESDARNDVAWRGAGKTSTSGAHKGRVSAPSMRNVLTVGESEEVCPATGSHAACGGVVKISYQILTTGITMIIPVYNQTSK